MSRKSKIIIGLAAASFALVSLAAVTLVSLQKKITSRLEKGWVLPPLEIYSQGLPLSAGRRFPRLAIQQEFEKRGLGAGRDYEFLDSRACTSMTGGETRAETDECLWIKDARILVRWNENEFIIGVWRGEPWTELPYFSLYPRLITQFYDGQPILQLNTPLSEIPLYCLQAVTAIEDRDFLEHRGVSPTGILRAVIRNLRAGRWAEGGSTITQQLVKNFFLDSRKTLRRKIEEQLLAIMLEAQIGKDQILEMYLNVIYMGQSGPYQVRGIGSAARYYFDKPIANLGLSECAMLAALINSPGRYSPFDRQPAATARRQLVLRKMKDEKMLTDAEVDAAAKAELPLAPAQPRGTHAPYFVLTALREFTDQQISTEEGARLYTTLDPEAQVFMLSAITKALPAIEARVRKAPKQALQVAAVTVDTANGQVIALTGGRDFRVTQYNRASDSRRQIGSIVKPFVYWPALKEHDAVSSVLDEPFEWKSGKATWKPRNYDNRTQGEVPYFWALANSLNIPAARIGQELGVKSIADVIARAGVTEKVPLLPSLTLGAFELSPLAVAQAYSTLARFGWREKLHTLERVEDIQGHLLYEHESDGEQELDARNTAVLVGMMEQTFVLGSARSAQAAGLEGAYAGKTGTTSDTKDAWFAGFDPRLLTVVWVGYDDNTAMGLTGASAALPLWIEIAKSYREWLPPGEFNWPPGTEMRRLSRDSILEQYPQLSGIPEEISLIFADWAY